MDAMAATTAVDAGIQDEAHPAPAEGCPSSPQLTLQAPSNHVNDSNNRCRYDRNIDNKDSKCTCATGIIPVALSTPCPTPDSTEARRSRTVGPSTPPSYPSLTDSPTTPSVPYDLDILTPTLPVTPGRKRSDPIDIPKASSSTHRNALYSKTPVLTARPTRGHCFPSFVTRPSFFRRTSKHSREAEEDLEESPKTKVMYGDRTAMYTPSSPLSPSYNPSMPSPPVSRLQGRNSERGCLKLNGLPRYHPANYANQGASTATPSLRPRSPASHSQTKPSSDVHQRLLQKYQREIIASATRNVKGPAVAIGKPKAPEIMPLGSPGPVTPLMLEEEGGYLVAGARAQDRTLLDNSSQREYVERLIREEEDRQRGGVPDHLPAEVQSR